MKKKSFNVRLQELGFNNHPNSSTKIREFLIGKTAEVISTGNGHNYGPVGTRFTISAAMYTSGGSGTNWTSLQGGIPGGNAIRFSQFHVIETVTEKDLKEEIKQYEKDLKSIEDSIENCKAKISYLKETGNDTYDENEFKAYRTLLLVDNKKLSMVEKAKLIAEMING